MADKKNWMILVVVVVVVALAAYLVFMRPTTNSAGAAGAYQAVFLVNNQVYFGKLANENAQFPVLTDIYYLQVNQAIQPVQTKPGQAASQTNPEINLVKLGGELHGPTDMMKINRDQILLIEDLRADSNLAKAIENYKVRQSAPVK